MKAFDVSCGGLRDGIPVKDGRIFCGESGRGRKLVSVRLPEGAVLSPSGDRLMEVSGPGALLRIMDHSGFRGGWRLRGARTPDEWDAIVETGAEVAERPIPGVMLLTGYCAQGDAGRMGGGPEYLLSLLPGQAVEVVRSGRLYGSPATLRVEVAHDETCNVTDPEASAKERAAGRAWKGAIIVPSS